MDVDDTLSCEFSSEVAERPHCDNGSSGSDSVEQHTLKHGWYSKGSNPVKIMNDPRSTTRPAAATPMKRKEWEQIEGSPLPLGATWMEEEQAFNFAIHAERAESVTLLFYGASNLVSPLLELPLRFSAQQVRTDLALPNTSHRNQRVSLLRVFGVR